MFRPLPKTVRCLPLHGSSRTNMGYYEEFQVKFDAVSEG